MATSEFKDSYADDDEYDPHSAGCHLNPDNRDSAAELLEDQIEMLERALKELRSLLVVANKMEKGSPAETALFRVLERAF